MHETLEAGECKQGWSEGMTSSPVLREFEGTAVRAKTREKQGPAHPGWQGPPGFILKTIRSYSLQNFKRKSDMTRLANRRIPGCWSGDREKVNVGVSNSGG